MTIARRAAWLCGGAMALVPQVTTGSTSQARLGIGVTVVAPCRVSARAEGAILCADRQAAIASLATKDETALNPPVARGTQAKSVKFVEISF